MKVEIDVFKYTFIYRGRNTYLFPYTLDNAAARTAPPDLPQHVVVYVCVCERKTPQPTLWCTLNFSFSRHVVGASAHRPYVYAGVFRRVLKRRKLFRFVRIILLNVLCRVPAEMFCNIATTYKRSLRSAAVSGRSYLLVVLPVEQKNIKRLENVGKYRTTRFFCFIKFPLDNGKQL